MGSSGYRPYLCEYSVLLANCHGRHKHRERPQSFPTQTTRWFDNTLGILYVNRFVQCIIYTYIHNICMFDSAQRYAVRSARVGGDILFWIVSITNISQYTRLRVRNCRCITGGRVDVRNLPLYDIVTL